MHRAPSLPSFICPVRPAAAGLSQPHEKHQRGMVLCCTDNTQWLTPCSWDNIVVASLVSHKMVDGQNNDERVYVSGMYEALVQKHGRCRHPSRHPSRHRGLIAPAHVHILLTSLVPHLCLALDVQGAIVLLHISKAFDTIDGEFLYQCLLEMSASFGMINLARLLLHDTRATTHVNGVDSTPCVWHS